MYVAFHQDPTTHEQKVITGRRSRIPTTLPTAAAPVDAVGGSFDPDTDIAPDIMVAARDGNQIQLFLAETANFRDNVFFENATVINTGPEPLRLFSTVSSIGGSGLGASTATASGAPLDLDGDGKQDVVAIFGGGGSGAFIRPLISKGDGTFTAGTDVPISGIPVDAIFADFDPPASAQGSPDLAILTVDTPGGAGTVRIFTGTGSTFAAGPTFAVGTNPVQLSAGLIDTDTDLDIAVANGGDNTISTFFGGAGAAFTPGAVLTSPGALKGVSVNTIFGTGGDVIFSYEEADTGHVGIYLREAAGDFAGTAVTQDILNNAGPLVTFDAGNDQTIDVLNLDQSASGAPGNLIVERTQRVTPSGGGPLQFGWAETPIIYPAGTAPTRIVPVDLNGDGNLDLLVPSSGSGTNGNNVAVYMSLGRYQYTNVNIYWTDGTSSDTIPQDATTQGWYVGHNFSGNQIELTVDATQFTSLTEIPPEELLRGGNSRNYLTVDMMTCDAPIDFTNKTDEDLGVVREHFTNPVIVPETIGFLDNNATEDRVSFPAAPPEMDITDWEIEAN